MAGDYDGMNVEDLRDMTGVDDLESMTEQTHGWDNTVQLFQNEINGLKADLKTARLTWTGQVADRYFLEVENTITSMENAQKIASGNSTAWKNIQTEAIGARDEVKTQYDEWILAKGALDDKKSEDEGFQLDDVGEVFGGKGNDVTTEDYNEKRKPFDEAARTSTNNRGQNMESEYLQNLWNPEHFNTYEPPVDPGPAPDWPGIEGSGKPGYRPPIGGDDGGPGGGDPNNPPQPPPGHGLPPELQTPPPVGPPPVGPPPVGPPPVGPPPVGPPPVVVPPPIGGPPPTGPSPTKPPPVVKPPVGRPTPPPTGKPPVVAKPTPPPTGRPTVPPTGRPPVTPPTGRPTTTTPPTGPRPPGRTVQPVIGGRGPTGPTTTTTGPIANAQRPNPTVRPITPQVIGQRGTTGPNGPAPGIRSNPMSNSQMTPGKAGMDTRGVFGTRTSKMNGMAQSAPAGERAAGVRSAPMRVGGEGLSRGVIMGAKQPAAGASNVPMGGAGRGTVRKRDEERTTTIDSDGPLDDLFNVDKTVVPGVIRGWAPQADTDHTAGPAVFGERPGKAVNQRKKKIEDEWDDW